MGRLVFLEPDSAARPSALGEAFVLSNPNYSHQAETVVDLAEVVEVMEHTPVDAVVLRWEGVRSPHEMVERFWQHPQLAQIPLIIVYAKLEASDVAFLAEYGHEDSINSSRGQEVAARQLQNMLRRITNSTLPASRAKEKGRRFFQLLHKGHFSEAEQFLEGHAEGFYSPVERLFYKALVLKMRKEFDRAVAYLQEALAMTEDKHKLAAKFLHLVGNVALKRRQFTDAVRFLEAANKLSPKNLRRRFLLGQCYLEMGDHIRALAQYSVIYRLCPGYPGIHVRMAELLFEKADTKEQIAKLGGLLLHVSDRELVSLCKRLIAHSKPQFKRQVLDLVIREFSIRANKLIDADEFYGALKPYKHIEKIIDKDDRERQQLLAYCYARVYYRAADYDLASKYIETAISLAWVPSEKLTALRALIDNAKAGKVA